MIDLVIAGAGLWTPGVPDWPQARALIAGGQSWPSGSDGRAQTSLMPPNERRRAPDSVLLALCVAEQACVAAGETRDRLASVFVSLYGDLAINDYMCATLRDEPAALSPTKFHNSVHNAPSGYWSIATGAMTPTTSLAAWRTSFAHGLLEAAVQVADSGAPVLVAAYEVTGSGPVAEVACVRQAFGCALVLAPVGSTGVPLRLATATGVAASPITTAGLSALAALNPIAEGAGALLEALAREASARVYLPLSPALALELELQP